MALPYVALDSSTASLESIGLINAESSAAIPIIGLLHLASCQTTIGYLVPEFPGQTHAFFWREIQSLSEMGISVELISTRRPHQSLKSHSWGEEATERTQYLWPIGLSDIFRTLRDCLRAPSVFMVPLGSESKSWKHRIRLLGLLICASKLNRLARIAGFRHVHVHSCSNAAYIANMASRMGNLTYSLTLHNPLSVYGPDQKLKWSEAAFGIVITQQIYQQVQVELKGFLPPRIAISPMGVDPKSFRRVNPYQPWRNGQLRLFCCARLNWIKGYDDLIDAVGLLRGKNVDAQLHIAGEDDAGGTGYRRSLEAKIKDLGLSGSVKLLGAVDEEKIRSELETAHLFVLASHAEPLGVAYMEAMLMGLPVMGTRAGGVSELIEHGATGWLVEPRKPEQLAAAIEELVLQPELCERLGENARHEIVENWTSRRSAQAIHDAISVSILVVSK